MTANLRFEGNMASSPPIEEVKGKLEFKDGDIQLYANPKVALAIIEIGSNEANNELQEMWAGLLPLLFRRMVRMKPIYFCQNIEGVNLTPANLLRDMCMTAIKRETGNGLFGAQTQGIYADRIAEITGIDD